MSFPLLSSFRSILCSPSSHPTPSPFSLTLSLSLSLSLSLQVSWALRRLGLPLPLIAASDVFLNVALVAALFRSAGAFFIRRGGARTADPLWAAVLEARRSLNPPHPPPPSLPPSFFHITSKYIYRESETERERECVCV